MCKWYNKLAYSVKTRLQNSAVFSLIDETNWRPKSILGNCMKNKNGFQNQQIMRYINGVPNNIFIAQNTKKTSFLQWSFVNLLGFAAMVIPF